METTGFYVNGMYIGSDTVKKEDGSKTQVIGVACGLTAYKVYMEEEEDVSALSLGDSITIKCRPYVGKNGRMGLSSGELMI